MSGCRTVALHPWRAAAAAVRIAARMRRAGPIDGLVGMLPGRHIACQRCFALHGVPLLQHWDCAWRPIIMQLMLGHVWVSRIRDTYALLVCGPDRQHSPAHSVCCMHMMYTTASCRTLQCQGQGHHCSLELWLMVNGYVHYHTGALLSMYRPGQCFPAAWACFSHACVTLEVRRSALPLTMVPN